MTVGEIIKLGLNMCNALSLCHSSGVIHRDIKEANIFINENGQYKLGDFGVAKTAIETTRAGSVKGTASHMAPELYLREPYDTSVDIYSLGIVLYKLLNNQRLPFMPEAPAVFTADDKNAAEARRLKGETPQLPVNAKGRLGEIVVKACSAKSGRYTKAEEFKKDLQELLQTMEEAEYDRIVIPPSAGGNQDAFLEEPEYSYTQTQGATMTMCAQDEPKITSSIPKQDSYTENEKQKKQKEKKKKKPVTPAVIIGVAVLVFCIAGFVLFSRISDPVNQFQEAVEKNDFAKAAQLYQNKLKSGADNELAETAAFITNRAAEVKEKYVREEIEYEDALNQLQEFEKIGIVSESEIKPVIEELNELRTSRMAYENAQKEMESGDYKAAIRDLHKVIQDDPNYADVPEKLAEAIKSWKEELTVSLSELEADKRYKDAVSALNEGLLLIPDDTDLLAKLAEMEESYAVEELAEAEKLADTGKYEEAVELLDEALKAISDNETIKDTIAEYKAKYPVLLQQMVYFTGKDLENGGQEQDNIQEMQTNIVIAENGGTIFDNVYKLNGKYKRITGNRYQPFEYRSDKGKTILNIYGDGRLLFSSEMGAGIEPAGFDIDLTSIEEIEIKTERRSGNSVRARLADVWFYQ